jgi:hypothetical protein
MTMMMMTTTRIKRQRRFQKLSYLEKKIEAALSFFFFLKCFPTTVCLCVRAGVSIFTTWSLVLSDESLKKKRKFLVITQVFIVDLVSTQVYEDVSVGYEVYQISATDNDLGDFGLVVYSLEGVDNSDGNFEINKQTVHKKRPCAFVEKIHGIIIL